jgi:tetratricopeptide (TPR) repeat protein
MSALQPWREQLHADPARVVAGVLDGWLDRGPWQRAEAMDFLLDLADGDATLSEQTAAAVLSWARDRLSWDERRRLRFGEIAHASRLADGFAVLQRLEAPQTAYQLAEQHAWFEARTRSMQFDGHLDLHRLLWLATAFQQRDDRFLPRWLAFCGDAARLLPGWQEWLRLGLTGLRMLSQGELPADQQALAGLLVFHQRAPRPLPPDAAKFEQRQLEVLKTLFPRGPTYWPEKLAEARERWPERRELPAWMHAPNGKKAPRQTLGGSLPTLDEVRKMGDRIRKDRPDRLLWQAIESVFRRCDDYALRSGDGEFLVKTVSNLGDRFLKRRPDAEGLHALLAWIRIGLDWDAGSAHLWTRLAECLSALNQDPAAEHILWEALRRFPDNEICRTSLAELLREQGQPDAAEALLRETMARFPDDVICRASLAELLLASERLAEAETLLEATIKQFPNDAHSRSILAKAWLKHGEKAKAEALLGESVRLFPRDKFFPTMLHALQAGRHDAAVAREKPPQRRPKTFAPRKPHEPAAALPDPLYAWAAERAPIIRWAFGLDRDADIRQQLQAAAHDGGAAELAEVALRLLFPEDALPLEDALRVRPGSPALRLLQAGPDSARGLRIAEAMPEAEPVLRSLYQTKADSSAWQPRFRAAVLAVADLSPPPVYIGAPA